MQKRTRRQSAFTLVEIMIVVAIIGLLAAIAIPNFIRAREKAQENACINNLRQIDGAIQQWALENKKGSTANVGPDDIKPYMGRGTGGSLPTCPSSSSPDFALSYSISTVQTPPTCLVATNHVLAN